MSAIGLHERAIHPQLQSAGMNDPSLFGMVWDEAHRELGVQRQREDFARV